MIWPVALTASDVKSLFFPLRNLRDELLDLDEASYEEVRDSLNDVTTVNR